MLLVQALKSLSEVASVKLGVAFKSAVKDAGADGSCYLIQTKDITLEGNIEFDRLVRVIPDSDPEKHYLKAGDIILRLRGPVFSAAIIDRDLDLPIIVTNQSAVIRCDTPHVLPYYLQWYINSKQGQKYFSGVSEGTSINKITAKIVANMVLELPNIEQQTRIQQIHQNWLAQKAAHLKLIDSGNAFFDELCAKIQRGQYTE